MSDIKNGKDVQAMPLQEFCKTYLESYASSASIDVGDSPERIWFCLVLKLNVEGSDELEFFGNFWAKVGEYYDEVTKKDDERKWDRLKMLDRRRMTQRKAAQQPAASACSKALTAARTEPRSRKSFALLSSFIRGVLNSYYLPLPSIFTWERLMVNENSFPGNYCQSNLQNMRTTLNWKLLRKMTTKICVKSGDEFQKGQSHYVIDVSEVKDWTVDLRGVPSVAAGDIMIYLLSTYQCSDDRLRDNKQDNGYKLYVCNHISEVKLYNTDTLGYIIFSCPKCEHSEERAKSGKGRANIFPFKFEGQTESKRTHEETVHLAEVVTQSGSPELGIKGPKRSDEGIPPTVAAEANSTYEWGERVTRYLIQLITDNWKKLELAYNKKPIWLDISVKLNKTMATKLTQDQCREKWNTLMKTCKSYKRQCSLTGNRKHRPFLFESDLDDLMLNDPSITPVLTMGSNTGAVDSEDITTNNTTERESTSSAKKKILAKKPKNLMSRI
ncbi:unnamed protein product [Mytilus edulis]|uniref:Myb/SANT-like DNA-binding domain-containing protein n=1 Tax=Mytilus edulis TaxID=6550 RepID=A0A8S3S9W9_MYTED|nr:unnamed protein product [Mytilus edulis]